MVGQLIIAAVLVIGVFVCTTPRSRVAEHVLRRVSDDRPSAIYGTVRRQTSQDLAAPRWRGSLRRPRQPVRAAREAALPACYRAFARPQPGGRALKWREARGSPWPVVRLPRCRLERMDHVPNGTSEERQASPDGAIRLPAGVRGFRV